MSKPTSCPPEILHILETLLQATAQTGKWRCAMVIFTFGRGAEDAEIIPAFSYAPRYASDEMLVKRFPAEEFQRLAIMLEMAAGEVQTTDVEIIHHKAPGTETKH